MASYCFFVAIAAALYGYIHYGREIPKKTLRPRTTTWLIWGVLSTCVAIVQLRHGAGLGSIGAIMGAVSGYVLALLSWRYGHHHIHRADVVSIILSLFVLLLWSVVGDTITVAAAALVYLIGFIPTTIRAYKKPHNERLAPFAMAVVKYVLSMAILGHFSPETVLYPAVLTGANLGFLVMVSLRRPRVY